MKKILLIFMLFSLCSYSQNRVDREQVELQKPISKLKKAKGWSFSEGTGKWSGQNKQIGLIDAFTELSFSKATYKGKEYLWLRKNYTSVVYKYPSLRLDASSVGMHLDYVMDLNEYKRAIRKLKRTDNEIRLKLVYFGTSFPTGFEIDKEQDPTHEILLKFRFNENEKYARFFLCELRTYTSENRDGEVSKSIWLDGLKNINSSSREYNDILDSLMHGDIFTKYYYETNINDFLNFILSPSKL